MTVTLAEVCETGISTCEADTTMDSATALTVNVTIPTSSGPATAVTARGCARKPSRATRSSYRPVSGAASANEPWRSVVAVAPMNPLSRRITCAPRTGCPSGSTTRPVNGPAMVEVAGRRERKIERTTIRTVLLRGVFRAGVRGGRFPSCGRKGRPGFQVSWLADRCTSFLRLPMHHMHSGAGVSRGGTKTPRIQWRHRVGVSPTSLGRRASQFPRVYQGRRWPLRYNGWAYSRRFF